MNHDQTQATANTDAREVAKFERLAADWWDPHGSLATLHAINPARLAFIEAAVKLNGARVLDVGCGGGLLSEAMAARGARVVGIDPSETSIRIAREHLAGDEVEYRACTVEEYAGTSPAPFDVITCMELLEHVPDPAALIERLAGLLKPGGHLFLATINRNIASYLGAIVAAEYLLNLLPRGTHDYARFIRPAELCGWLRRAGFDIAAINGMQYLPLIRHAVLTRHPTVNYLVHARRAD